MGYRKHIFKGPSIRHARLSPNDFVSHGNGEGWLRSSVFIAVFPTLTVGYLFGCHLIVFSFSFDSKFTTPFSSFLVRSFVKKRKRRKKEAYYPPRSTYDDSFLFFQ